MDKINFYGFIILLFFSSIVFAQTSDSTKIYHLSEVVVTATKTKTPELEVASSISVIDSAEISRSVNNSVFGLLKDQYGLSFSQQGAPGSLSYIYLRGADPGQTLVLIDGVDMNMPNDPSNTFDFADLPVDNIKRIEILRGPQSTLYGSNAMAGVINIITKKGYGRPKFFLSSEGGSYNTYKLMGGVDGSTGPFNYTLTLSKFKSGGFSSASSKYGNTERDGTRNYNISSRTGYNISKNFNLNLFIRYAKANTSLDQHGGLHGDDPTYVYGLEEYAYHADGNLSLLGGKWQQTFGAYYFRNVRKYSFDSTLYNPASSSSIYDGKRFKFSWQNNFKFLKNNTLTLGLETEKEEAISDYYYTSYPGGLYTSIFPNNQTTTTGVYLQDQVNLAQSFFGSAGVRYDHQSRFGSVVTYRIAPAYIFWATGTKIKATFGTGFKAPSLFYLFDPSYGNKNLKPEKSTGWDAGIEQYFWGKNITIGLNYFNNRYTDLFGFDNNFKTINIDKAVTNGIEFYLRASLLKNINVNLNYTYTNAKDESPNSATYGQELIRRPKNKIDFELNYNFLKNANALLQVTYVGKCYDTDFSTYPETRVILKSHTVVNLAASYHLTSMVEITGRIDNLFNTYYEEIFGYATPGLSGYAGIKFTF